MRIKSEPLKNMRDVFRGTLTFSEISIEIFLKDITRFYALAAFFYRINYKFMRKTYHLLIRQISKKLNHEMASNKVSTRSSAISFNADKKIAIRSKYNRFKDTILLSKIFSFFVHFAVPKNFWFQIFIILGLYSVAFRFLQVSNAQKNLTIRQLYLKAIVGTFSGAHTEAFEATIKILNSGDNSFKIAALLTLCAVNLSKQDCTRAVALLYRMQTSYGTAMAVILLTSLNKISAASKLLMAHVHKFPEDAEAAAEYQCLILNKWRESLTLYDQALTLSPRNDLSLRFKRAMNLPLHLSSPEEIDAVRCKIISNLEELLANPHPSNLHAYFETYPAITVMGVNLDPLYPIIYHDKKDVSLATLRSTCFLANFPELKFISQYIDQARASECNKIRVGLFTESMYPQIDLFYGSMFELFSKDLFHITLFIPKGLPPTHLPRLKTCADELMEYPYPRACHSVPSHMSTGAPAFAETRQIVASAKLDVFYNTFIGQDMMSQFLAYARLAPVQVTDATRMTTTGMPEIDYYMMHKGDFIGEPSDYFTEKLAILKGNNQALLDLLSLPPAIPNLNRPFFQLPDDKSIYLCIQDLTRRHPAMDKILALLLNRDASGVLLVSDFGTPGIWYEFVKNLGKLGVENPEKRISKAPVFLALPYPKTYYYAFLRLADANLTYRGMCGGTPFYDHLVAGIPQIVWPSDTIANGASAIYRRMGLNECFAASESDYVEKAYRLAHDKNWKAELTVKLRSRLPEFISTCQKENLPEEMMRFFNSAIRRFRSNLPPAHWYNGNFYDNASNFIK